MNRDFGTTRAWKRKGFGIVREFESSPAASERIKMKNESTAAEIDRAENAVPAVRAESGDEEVLDCVASYLSRSPGLDLKALLETLARRIIIEVLQATNGVQKDAAVRLGIKNTTLNEKIKKYGIGIHRRMSASIFLAAEASVQESDNERSDVLFGRA